MITFDERGDHPWRLLDASWVRWQQRTRPLAADHPLHGRLIYEPVTSGFERGHLRAVEDLLADRGPLRHWYRPPQEESRELTARLVAAGSRAIPSVCLALTRFLLGAQARWTVDPQRVLAECALGGHMAWSTHGVLVTCGHKPVAEPRTDPVALAAVSAALERWTTHPDVFWEPARALSEASIAAVHALGGWQQATDAELRTWAGADSVQEWALCDSFDVEDCGICRPDHFMAGHLDNDTTSR
ncbi:hypothetical protein [Streptomyces violascens]|uniref:hypothetical protein n=1 Tax=Streptomyces violascens TaxID=67381 RepID=UPI00167B52DC|nr:hypothetical protein [Streptomyces violascens]GGU30191.1 hypothetical protein GCM10010289_59520 [Streptomyces violascens]